MKRLILVTMVASAAFFTACDSGNASINKKDSSTLASNVKYNYTHASKNSQRYRRALPDMQNDNGTY
jgi:hypothetical protein